MSIKSANNIKYIFSTIKSSFLPAFLLFLGLLLFYAQSPYPFSLSLILHYTFIFIAVITAVLLGIADKSKPFFSLMLGLTTYCIINYLKVQSAENFINTPQFRCLCFILPINFVILYFLPQSKLWEKRNLYIILLLLVEAVVFTKICHIFNYIPYIDITFEAMPLWACMLWIILLAPMAINISFKNTVNNTGLFYADTGLFLGMVYAAIPSGQSTFFLSFALILLCTALLNLRYLHHYDYLENVGSKIAYISHANTKFPYKYTIALFSIDNRDKLLSVIGGKKMRVLEQMVVNRILQLPYEINIYRYNEEELIMVFKNESAKHVKEFADNIRRNIAAAEFVFSSGKSLKITISACVSEKTRKDLDANEVTERTHNALQKSYRFNCNIVTTA